VRAVKSEVWRREPAEDVQVARNIAQRHGSKPTPGKPYRKPVNSRTARNRSAINGGARRVNRCTRFPIEIEVRGARQSVMQAR